MTYWDLCILSKSRSTALSVKWVISKVYYSFFYHLAAVSEEITDWWVADNYYTVENNKMLFCFDWESQSRGPGMLIFIALFQKAIKTHTHRNTLSYNCKCSRSPFGNWFNSASSCLEASSHRFFSGACFYLWVKVKVPVDRCVHYVSRMGWLSACDCWEY